MAEQVVPGIYRLKVALPDKSILLGYVNVYLVPDENGHLLIDTGWDSAESLESLESQMHEAGFNIGDIARVISTHSHVDHYGLAGKLKQLSGASLALHPQEKSIFYSARVDAGTLLNQENSWLSLNGVPEEPLAKFRNDFVKFSRYMTPPSPDRPIADGEVISAGRFNFQVIWTPGHSPGHICLYEPAEKILISGDHVLPMITPHIGLHPQSSLDPLTDYINSLKKVAALAVDTVLPAHESPFTGLQKRVDELIGHHDQRNSEILKAMDGQARTAYQIASRMTWLLDVGGRSYDSLSLLDKRLAIMETLAHLESMRNAGKVHQSEWENVVVYSA